MKHNRQFFAFFAALVLILSFGMNASAMAGGGIQETEEYTIGIDLSVWNIGGSSVMDYSKVDFEKLKADGCDFAILRIGFEGSKTGENTLDLAFVEYYNRAREAGMKLGLYFYPLGTTYEEAVDDAEWVISVIEEHNMYFEYPIYYDVEDGKHYALNAKALTDLCLGWCETMENAGYFPGVYGKTDILDKLSDDFVSRYDCWLRYMKSDRPTLQYSPEDTNVSDRCGLWQYTMFQKFDGIDEADDLDGNVSYKDYESIMRENGYNNYPEPVEESVPVSSEPVSSEESVSEDDGIGTLGIVAIVGGCVAVIGAAVAVLIVKKNRGKAKDKPENENQTDGNS